MRRVGAERTKLRLQGPIASGIPHRSLSQVTCKTKGRIDGSVNDRIPTCLNSRVRITNMRWFNRVKAVAIHESTGSSFVVAQDFKQYSPTGIGMVLEQVHGLRGIYVIKIVPGGAAWRGNEVRVGDEIRMIDNIPIQDMGLDEVTRLILGQAGTEVRARKGPGATAKGGGGRNLDVVGISSSGLHRCFLYFLLTHFTRARTQTHKNTPAGSAAHSAGGQGHGWNCSGRCWLPVFLDNRSCTFRH